MDDFEEKLHFQDKKMSPVPHCGTGKAYLCTHKK